MNREQTEMAIRHLRHERDATNTPHIIAACDFAIEALERATPKTPVRDSLADRACPACDAYIPWDALNEPMEYAPLFCKSCGQAIDWSEEKKE